MNISDKIIDLIVDLTGDHDAKAKINKDTNLMDSFGIDSIQLMQLIVMLEDSFDIEFLDDDLSTEQLSNFFSLCEFVESALNRQCEEN